MEAESGRAAPAYKIVDDDHDFIHLRLKKEIDWERQRKSDAQKQSLIVPVRLRDGDACRWCGVVVNWSDHKSGRAATYDHLDPGEAATIETYVVACRSCNSSRQAGEFPQGVTALLDPPEQPYFSRSSVKWLTENKWRIDEGLPVPEPSATHINPGRRPDGSQPPGPARPVKESRTRVAPAAPSDDQTRDAKDNGVQFAPSDRDSTPTRVAPVAPSVDGSDTPRDDEPDLTRVAPVAPSGPDSSPVERRHDLSPPAPISTPLSPGGLITSPSPPAATPIRPISDGYQRDRMNRRGTGPVESGRDGSGRVRSGLPTQPDTSGDCSRPQRGGRRRRSRLR